MPREWNPQSTAKEKKLFTGYERDAETGLDYFGARYYRPQIGRFTTISENLVDPQRWNRSAYVANNPLKCTDPDGRVPVLVEWTGYEAYVLAVGAARPRRR